MTLGTVADGFQNESGVKAKIAYLNDRPYELKEGETILAFIKTVFG
jgi:hypothetical protein